MSFLSDTAIRGAIARGLVKISPFAEHAIGTNSVDLHLAPELLVYDDPAIFLRTDRECRTRSLSIDPETGFVLLPGELYLGATVETTSCGPYLPFIDGTSGAGRLGMSVHVTAGIGDVGFAGRWTLEITVVRPLLVFGGEPVAQLLLATVEGEVDVPYGRKPAASYAGQAGPVVSRLYKKPRFRG